ncbi:MAG: fructosamine kinase family protein [Synechococcaceae cyanobacterium]
MPNSADDALQDWIQQRTGHRLRRRSAVGGGCIHAAWKLELEGGELLFAKSCPLADQSLLAAEADGLAALDAAARVSPPTVTATPLRVPRPLAQGVVADQALLLLPWLEIHSASDPATWRHFGAALAALHRGSLGQVLVAGDRCHGFHGWWRANWIGSTPQINTWCEAWGRFFSEYRLAPQLGLLARRGGALSGAAELLERVPSWLASHCPEPTLVHGDLWSGNGALLRGGGAAVFDPAVYRGDREVDLAMARLFGGFPAAFFAGYEQAWPLPAGHRRRVDLYNLYHLLNHANLFGGGYRDRSQALIRELLANPPEVSGG